MSRSALTLHLDLERSGPIYRAIARALSDDIRRGRLKSGQTLPGTRTLARELGVNRNTVLAAYRELVAEGWAVTSTARGTFVAPELDPKGGAARGTRASARVAARLGFELSANPYEPLPAAPAPLSLGGGLVDVRLAPWQDFARAYRRVLARSTAPLRYGDPRGHAAFRAAIASLVTSSRGVVCDADQVLVTRGSQMAVALFARAVLRPGDVVAVEALGYPPAWAALREAGAELVPIAVDSRGLDVDALAAVCRRRRVRAVYVTPHHQYPTTVTMAASRRLALLELAAETRMAILEDDYDHEFHYDGRPVLPLASADTRGLVVYVGTFSKVLAPGLRTGFVVAPTALVDRMAGARAIWDRQGDLVLEAALAELIEDGTLERHVRRVRRIYRGRRDAFLEDVTRLLSPWLTVSAPPGGTAVWARVRGVDVGAWGEAALARGVPFQPGRRFALAGRPGPFARMGFVALSDGERVRALGELAAAAKGLPKRARRG